MFFRRITVGELVTNSYLYANEESKSAILFDAAANPEKLLKLIDENGFNLKYIFQTHAHYDHIGALDELKAKTNAKIVIHESEVKYLYDPTLNLSYDLKISSKPDIIVKDNDIIDFEGTKIKVIHTPGHTTGSCCFLFDDVLISGDTLFLKSIGRTDFPLGSLEDELFAIKTKLMPLNDNVTVHPGHGFATNIGSERKENPYLI